MKNTPKNLNYSSLDKINELNYKHQRLLLAWPVYFLLYWLTEKLIPAGRCFVVHCALDDIIPFCELFVIPYICWYLLIAISLGYFLFHDVDNFKKLQSYIIILQAIASLIYIAVPTRQELRPEFFARENVLTKLVAFIYSMDTNTGVCPSLHCAISIAIASVWLKKQDASRKVKICVGTLCTLICLSTSFIKQHSVLDFLAAIALCIIAEFLVFHKLYPNKEGWPLPC